MAATLRILGDATSALRAFDAIDRRGRETARNIARAFQGARSSVTAQMQGMERAVGAEVAKGADAARRGAARRISEEERVTRATEREARKRERELDKERRAAERSNAAAARAAERAQQQQTRAAERESAARVRAEQRSQGQIARALANARAYNRREDAREQRESEARAAARSRGFWRGADRVAGFVGGAGRRLGGAAVSAASDVVGQVTDARHRRAGTERELGLALYQAGANRGEVQQRMQRLTQFAAVNGMSSQEIAEAANAAQTEFSSLSAGTAAERGQRFEGLLQTSLLARNTGNNPAEFTRLQGMLAQSGFDAQQQRQMLLYTAGASQAGAVEAGQLTREGMGAIMRRMSQASAALGANATPEQRQAAAAAAFREQVGTLQVARGFGNSVTQAGNAVSAMSSAMAGTQVQDRMLSNIRTRRETTTNADERARLQSLEESLFEQDPNRARGSMRLRAGMGPMQVAAALASRGMDATFANNLFAGTGPGNAQSFQANWRRMLGVMLSQDTQGVSGADRINRLMNPNVALTEADVARGADIFGNDATAQLHKQQEERDNMLTNNTSALFQLSQSLERFRMESPMRAALAAQGGAAAEMGAASLYVDSQDAAAAATANALGRGAGPRTLRQVLMANAASQAQQETGSLGGVLGYLMRDPLSALAPGGSRQSRQAELFAQNTQGLTNAQLNQQVSNVQFTPQAIAQLVEGLRNAPLTATIDPAAAAQTLSQQRTGGAPTPPPGRQ